MLPPTDANVFPDKTLMLPLFTSLEPVPSLKATLPPPNFPGFTSILIFPLVEMEEEEECISILPGFCSPISDTKEKEPPVALVLDPLLIITSPPEVPSEARRFILLDCISRLPPFC